MVGERSPVEPCDYGIRGNSIVRHAGESYENIVLVGGFSKAYSSLLAFIACPTPLKQVLKTAAPPYLYSGPSPVASLATVLEGLRVNDERGDQLRARSPPPHRSRPGPGPRARHRTPNQSGFPIIEVPLADADTVDEVGDLLFDRGIYVTMAVYPLVPREEVGFRLQLTAANTDEQVDHLRGARRGRRALQAAQRADRLSAAMTIARIGRARRRSRPPTPVVGSTSASARSSACSTCSCRR